MKNQQFSWKFSKIFANVAKFAKLNFAKFQKFQLYNLVDFEKCCKTHIFLQKSEPIQPKSSNILPKCWENGPTTPGPTTPTTPGPPQASKKESKAWPSLPRLRRQAVLCSRPSNRREFSFENLWSPHSRPEPAHSHRRNYRDFMTSEVLATTGSRHPYHWYRFKTLEMDEFMMIG